MTLFEKILKSRGLSGELKESFLHPRYESGHDPFLLPDMENAVNRLVVAREAQEQIMIYGDYDIDGLTATTVLVDAFTSFGFMKIDTFIPNRFVEGYGLTIDAVERISKSGATLIVTVDCGSLSKKEIIYAQKLGVDVIVTDHHNVATVQPPAIAVVNPKRLLQDFPDSYKDFVLIKQDKRRPLYPFLDLPGVGVAFKLVQALQSRLDGLPYGHEKWLLDLVALGTVCDVVTLVNENRMHVYWGLKVLEKTRRPGLKALMSVSGVDSATVTARSLGFGLGPRMNASGRLDTAKHAQEMLLATDGNVALEKAELLDSMNKERRVAQESIMKKAVEQAELFPNDKVLVLSHTDWSHGIIGIVAAKLLEKYKKPTYVLQELGDESKGSARSFGDFSVADAIQASVDIITKGGGHKFAAGVTLPTKNIDAFRMRVNEFYRSLELESQEQLLLPKAEVIIDNFKEVNELLIDELAQLEPFGSGNLEPVLQASSVRIIDSRTMGVAGQHLRLGVADGTNLCISLLAFNAPQSWLSLQPGETISIWFQPTVNEWKGRRTVEGRLLYLEIS